MEIKTKPMEIQDIGHGDFTAQFNDVLQSLYDIVAEPQKYVPDSRGNLRGEITAKVVIVHNVDHETTHVAAAAHPKFPKRYAASNIVYTKSGEFLVQENPAKQQGLDFETDDDGTVTPISDAASSREGE